MSLHFDNGSYGLRQASSGNKTVLLMKLTDSALRIIESYLDNEGSSRSKPSIQFQGNQGVISIPAPRGESEVQKFSFQVSNLPPETFVDCLQHVRTAHSEQVECLGKVSQKITINAKDDSYDMTRQRMALAKQEEQKTSTKEIKQPGTKMGKVFKKSVKGRTLESHHSSKPKLSPDTRAPTPPISRLTPTLMNRSSSPLTLPGKDRSNSPTAPGMGRNKTKPTITISGQKGGTSPNTSRNPAVAERSLRDRVTHLLAVRPYKHPEILLRLHRDKPPDKNKLSEILQKVATLRNTQGVGHEYCLMRNNYNSLEPDTWPGYTTSERKAVKKKIADMNASAESRKRPYPITQSPNDINIDTQNDEDYANPAMKKRVSHIKGLSSGNSSPLDGEKSKSRSPGNANKRDLSSPEKGKNSVKISPRSHDKRSPISAIEEISGLNGAAVDFDLSDSQEEDYLKKYTEISSDEQRNRYKNDFYAEYEEYLSHHNSVAEVSRKFAHLQKKLNEHEKGSEGYKQISRQVIQEYRKTKKDDAYHRERARWQFLHRKLRHIKELVSDFDRHKLSNNRPRNQNQFSMQTATKVA